MCSKGLKVGIMHCLKDIGNIHILIDNEIMQGHRDHTLLEGDKDL